MTVIEKVPRLPFAIANSIMAFAVFVIGIGVTLAAGYYNTDRFLNSPGKLQKFSDSVVTAMMVAGLLLIIVSMLGAAVLKVRNLLLSRCYGFLLVPGFIILLICSIQFGQVVQTGDKGLTSLCDSSVFQEDALKDLYRPYKEDIDGVIVPMTSKWMCSKQCACDETQSLTWSQMTEGDLNNFQRTKDQLDLDDTDGTVRLHFIARSNMNETIFNSFADCFYEWKSDWSGNQGEVPRNWEASAQADFERINNVFSSIELVEYLWLKKQCNGICKYGIFTFAGVTSDGVPERECQEVASDLFAQSGPMIWGWLMAGTIVTLVAFVIQLTLCCRYKPRTKEMKVPYSKLEKQKSIQIEY